MSVDILKVLQSDLNDDDFLKDLNISLIKIQYLIKSDRLRLYTRSSKDCSDDIENRIKKIFTDRFGHFENIDIVYYKNIKDVSIDEICSKYWSELADSIISSYPVCRECLLKGQRYADKDTITIRYGNKFICEMLRNRKLESVIKNAVYDIYGIKCSIKILYDSSLETQNYFLEKEKQESSLIKKAVYDALPDNKAKKSVKQNDVPNYPHRENTTSKSENVILGKNINEEPSNIKLITDVCDSAVIEGDIFKADIIETKTKKKIVTFFITDLTYSITVKFFLRAKDEEKVLSEIKPGLHCKVRGEVINDQFAKEIVIMAKDIVKTHKIEKMDLCEEKRVELHVHTQMSAMDAVSSASSLVSQAAKWGHKAIAITDHGVVQAYPEAMECAKKNNIKILYGIEAYFVDDGMPIVLNADNKTIDDTFVVFDIETTGLSTLNDRIIEIGAVKIVKKKITERFSSFVNPEIHIPENITKLTSIDDDTVKDAEKIDTVIQKFMAFCEGSILAAHNAPFDVSFIKKYCRAFNMKFDNAVMDTVPLCRYLFPDLKKYKLDTVAKHLGISLLHHHRAVDDAEATALIMLNCFNLLQNNQIVRLDDLNKDFLSNVDIKKLPMYHLIILVKNMTGLKNLYKMVSKSNLDYFYKKPRMPKSLIEKYREGLIIGSACEAGQIYRELLQGKSDDEMEEFLKFYDYLEIQPCGNNMFMVRNGTVKSVHDLQEINMRICTLGDKYKLPVVATCDVHFLRPEDEVYRRILMFGQGYNDADEQPPLYLRTTDEMLKEFQYLGENKAKEVVIYNTQKIADMIENVKPIPDETFPPKIEGAEEEIKNMTLKKVHSIYGDVLPEIVQKRIDKELNSIINNGYAVLYLIAEKLVAKSYKDGYLVGSRGSVGSSLVATMSNITEVNGLPPHYVCPNCKYSEFITDESVGSGADLDDKNCPKCGTLMKKDGHDIPFETFLGFEGDKEPDIDLNFSGEYQSTVHKYTEVLFGKGHVFKAGTIGTVAEKTAYGFVKKYTTQKNLNINSAETERLTLGCTGVKRTSGQHPGGIIVVPSDNDIHNFTPIQHPADDTSSDIITTHFDYHSISGRLLKLDILGHDDPTVLRMLQDITGLDPKSIPLGDHKVMSLFTSPQALGVSKEELGCEVGTYGLPEFGTKFVRQMLIDTQPKTFADLVRISGLSHGTNVWLNNAQYYIKEGYTTLRDCIATRDDIMMYLIHKGLPPKTAFNIMEKVRKGKGLSEEHESVMREYNVPDWYIESCKKIKYMFPKGHAVAYVMMAVRIAYYKVYYPKAYYATYFTVRADEFDADIILDGEYAIKKRMDEINAMGNNATQKDKNLLTILELSYEMYKRGIRFLKADLYKSDPIKFIIEDDGIRIPLKALEGVGENAAKNIAYARSEGAFISKEDLKRRAKASGTVIDALTSHGCLIGIQETNQLSLFSM